MAYQRNDENCDPVSPQPGSTTVNWFSGTEGWSTKTFKNWNRPHKKWLQQGFWLPSKGSYGLKDIVIMNDESGL